MTPVWTDPATGLEWGPTAPERMTWRQAVSWCRAQGDGWRLPTVDELETILDRSCYDPAVVEPLRAGTVSSYYWSSTTYANYPGYAWYVYFTDGYVNANLKTGDDYVRAVRGGSITEVIP